MNRRTTNKPGVLKKLFFSTFYLSAFTFGGGYVIITLLKQKFVDELHWISEEEMLDFLYHKAFFHVDGGSAYGAPGFIRMCVASPAHCVEKALGDLETAWKEKNQCC